MNISFSFDSAYVVLVLIRNFSIFHLVIECKTLRHIHQKFRCFNCICIHLSFIRVAIVCGDKNGWQLINGCFLVSGKLFQFQNVKNVNEFKPCPFKVEGILYMIVLIPFPFLFFSLPDQKGLIRPKES